MIYDARLCLLRPMTTLDIVQRIDRPWRYRVEVRGFGLERSVSGDQCECPIAAPMPPLDP